MILLGVLALSIHPVLPLPSSTSPRVPVHLFTITIFLAFRPSHWRRISGRRAVIEDFVG